MTGLRILKSLLIGGAAIVATSQAHAEPFDIPGGDLGSALSAYSRHTGIELLYLDEQLKGIHTRGAQGELTASAALSRILAGTGFTMEREASAVAIVRDQIIAKPSVHKEEVMPVRIAAAAASVETVVVTSSKIKGDIQTVPIAITALSQEQLTERQIAGGPDLVKEVPNLTFTKTNFTGYNLEIRGIGTQAVSVTTDPAVAVAFNDTPFLRNHFFEQEFFDVNQVEVLRGPQGTLFGRNANAGVVNIVSAKPTDQFEAMLSADWGNYTNRRYEGMINIPIVDEKLALRIAGEWTKRDGYAFNEVSGKQIDGRDLWSGRATLRWKPTESVTSDFIWEHFQENDDRLRSGKQLCHTDPGPTSFTEANGTVVQLPPPTNTIYDVSSANFSQGCLPGSLYDKGNPSTGNYGAFGAPNGFSLPFVTALQFTGYFVQGRDPYLKDYQSTNLRDIESQVPSQYIANSDTLEFNTEWRVAPTLTFSSETGYNSDFLWSLEDFNRFETAPGVFNVVTFAGKHITFPTGNFVCSDGTYFVGGDSSQCNGHGSATPTGYYCDPQLGCSDRLVVEDLSTEHSWQLSQEFRLASDFKGPLNFSAGGNYLHYETEDKFYVFSNSFTLITYHGDTVCDPNDWMPGVSDGLTCLNNGRQYPTHNHGGVPSDYPAYVDPNPISSLNDNGHNYFLSRNPYVLNSYALFGEAYYDLTKELKLTGGLRWTDDEKHFPEYPSRTLNTGYYGIPQNGEIDQSWKKFSGRAVVNWTPQLDFTDQTMIYASYSHGYKAGGANPPPAVLSANKGVAFPIHPLTFDPEYIDAYELGTKNTALDGSLVFNGDVFYYDYKGYQISEIVDRTAININVDATVQGAEIQTTWEPLQGLKLGFNGGYESTRIKDNQFFIDLMDRTYGHHDTWTIMKPWAGEASNCVVPDYFAASMVLASAGYGQGNPVTQTCGTAYNNHLDPITGLPYVENPTVQVDSSVYPRPGGIPAGYPGFDPVSDDPNAPADVNNGLGLAPNNGQGFAKPIGGNQLPNAPHFTTSLTAAYTMPISPNWAATLHSDFYWQSQSFARIFNDRPYDKIRGYSNVNLALILNDAAGWQIMGYVKNIFDTTAITGDFLYSDDVGLTTNIFLTDPRLYGVRITKQFSGDSTDSGIDFFSSADGKRPQIWLTLGGNFNATMDASNEIYLPGYARVGSPADMTALIAAAGLPSPASVQRSPNSGFDWQGMLTFQPGDSDWVLKAGIRYGRSVRRGFVHKSLPPPTKTAVKTFGVTFPCTYFGALYGTEALHSCKTAYNNEFADEHGSQSERHAILDFTLGKDVGIGAFGDKGSSIIGAGLRAAQFGSRARSDINSDPEYFFAPTLTEKYHNVYESRSQERRSFHGIGPEIVWDANSTVWGNSNDGEITVDWGVNAAVLFGKQRVDIHHFSSYCYNTAELGGGLGGCNTGLPGHTRTGTVSRSRSVTVPNLGGYVGFSARYQDAKISLGYRADEFFDAMDGGQDTAKKYNRGFYGPYLNLSIGFGG